MPDGQTDVVQVGRQRRIKLLADVPEGSALAFRLGQDGIDDIATFHTRLEQALESRCIGLGIGTLGLGNHVIRMIGTQWQGMTTLTAYRGDVGIPHDLEGAQRASKVCLQSAELPRYGIEGSAGKHRRVAAAGLGIESHHNARNHAERAFAANKQLLEIVAGVVFQHLVH